VRVEKEENAIFQNVLANFLRWISGAMITSEPPVLSMVPKSVKIASSSGELVVVRWSPCLYIPMVMRSCFHTETMSEIRKG